MTKFNVGDKVRIKSDAHTIPARLLGKEGVIESVNRPRGFQYTVSIHSGQYGIHEHELEGVGIPNNLYNEGDLVQAVKGENIARGRLFFNEDDSLQLLELELEGYLNNGYQIELIEKAREPLPTVFGFYIGTRKDTGERFMYNLSRVGRWYFHSEYGSVEPRSQEIMHDFVLSKIELKVGK